MKKILLLSALLSLITIDFGEIPAKTFGDLPFSLPDTSSAGLTLQYKTINTEVATINGNRVTIVGAGTTEIKIVNHSDGDREFKLSNIPGSSNIYVDNNNGIIQELNYNHNLYGGFNMNFFRLVHGDNELTITGNSVVSIAGRFLYNVAG